MSIFDTIRIFQRLANAERAITTMATKISGITDELKKEKADVQAQFAAVQAKFDTLQAEIDTLKANADDPTELAALQSAADDLGATISAGPIPAPTTTPAPTA